MEESRHLTSTTRPALSEQYEALIAALPVERREFVQRLLLVGAGSAVTMVTLSVAEVMAQAPQAASTAFQATPGNPGPPP